MPYPRQADIELPLLEALLELGGEGRPRDVYPLVAKRFPQLTPEELEERLPNYPSTRKWSNLVQWVRQRLVDLGQIDGSQRGTWTMTPTGRARLQEETSAVHKRGRATQGDRRSVSRATSTTSSSTSAMNSTAACRE